MPDRRSHDSNNMTPDDREFILRRLQEVQDDLQAQLDSLKQSLMSVEHGYALDQRIASFDANVALLRDATVKATDECTLRGPRVVYGDYRPRWPSWPASQCIRKNAKGVKCECTACELDRVVSRETVARPEVNPGTSFNQSASVAGFHGRQPGPKGPTKPDR